MKADEDDAEQREFLDDRPRFEVLEAICASSSCGVFVERELRVNGRLWRPHMSALDELVADFRGCKLRERWRG